MKELVGATFCGLKIREQNKSCRQFCLPLQRYVPGFYSAFCQRCSFWCGAKLASFLVSFLWKAQYRSSWQGRRYCVLCIRTFRIPLHLFGICRIPRIRGLCSCLNNSCNRFANAICESELKVLTSWPIYIF